VSGFERHAAALNFYRDEIIAKSPPDAAIRILGVIAGLGGVNYR
jgi:hypothetical protein